jgi:hypothetical protein
MPAASFVAIAVRANPVPRGCVVAPVTKTPFGRHENVQVSRRSTKRLRRVLDLSNDSQGLVETNVPQAVEEI